MSGNFFVEGYELKFADYYKKKKSERYKEDIEKKYFKNDNEKKVLFPPLSGLGQWGVSRECNDSGKGSIEENIVRTESFRKAVVEIVRQFDKDMDTYGPYLSKEERALVEKDFFRSLSGEKPGYELAGSYQDKNGVKQMFFVSAKVVRLREKTKSRDIESKHDYGKGPSGGGSASAIPVLRPAVWVPDKRKEKEKKKPNRDFPPEITM